MIALALAALALAGCPHDAALGSVSFQRGGTKHVVSLATCRERIGGRFVPRAAPPVRGVIVRDHALWARRGGRLVRLTPSLHGPDGLRAWPEPLSLSPDGRYVLWVRAAVNSNSYGADGLPLAITLLAGGRTRQLGISLGSPDYWAWCGSALVFVAGGNRIATTNKRLEIARAPDWTPRPLWRAPTRAFGSLACAPDGRSVAVLSQRASTNAYFFATRWQLWRVSLDGSHRLLDAPPAGDADESPQWSRDGRALLFVRERKGYGSLMLWRAGRVVGPFANLGYSLGYYGHHAWSVVWSAAAH
ncbi:MAG TPA: hypothetical protein VFA19_02080 [Gaiellaceae bacterium]|nr:hypothetical protein [Gaiellaceae bacterium]